MIIFKGYDLKTKGIIVESLPIIQKAKKRIDTYEIYGRNGFLSVDNNTYDSWELQVECHLADNANMDNIAKFLDGYGTISFDGIKQSTAIVNNNIPFETIFNSGFKKFTLSFLVNPIFEDIADRVISLPFSAQDNYYASLLEGTFNYNIYPKEIEIEISSDADFYINRRKFSLKSGHYFLDCKNKEIYDSNHVNQSSKMSGDFPYLDTSGSNLFICSINPTKFKMTYNNTHLMG